MSTSQLELLAIMAGALAGAGLFLFAAAVRGLPPKPPRSGPSRLERAVKDLFSVRGAIAVIVGLIFLGPAAVQAIIAPILQRFLACRPCEIALAVVLALLAAYWIKSMDVTKLRWVVIVVVLYTASMMLRSAMQERSRRPVTVMPSIEN